MDATIKDKWVTALRSGKYQQGVKALRTTADGKDSYCCLGVLCDIVAPEGWTAYVIDSKEHWQHDDQGDVPSGRLLDYIGLRSRRLMEKLVTMNDTEEWSFEAIANWIEMNLVGDGMRSPENRDAERDEIEERVEFFKKIDKALGKYREDK